MKFLICFLCAFFYALITWILNSQGRHLGAIPTLIFISVTIWLARAFCKAWDERKENKKAEMNSVGEKSNHNTEPTGPDTSDRNPYYLTARRFASEYVALLPPCYAGIIFADDKISLNFHERLCALFLMDFHELIRADKITTQTLLNSLAASLGNSEADADITLEEIIIQIRDANYVISPDEIEKLNSVLIMEIILYDSVFTGKDAATTIKSLVPYLPNVRNILIETLKQGTKSAEYKSANDLLTLYFTAPDFRSTIVKFAEALDLILEATDEVDDSSTQNTNQLRPHTAPVNESVSLPSQIETIIDTSATQKPGGDKIRFCRKCGSRLMNDAVFCSKCGTKVIKE